MSLSPDPGLKLSLYDTVTNKATTLSHDKISRIIGLYVLRDTQLSKQQKHQGLAHHVTNKCITATPRMY